MLEYVDFDSLSLALMEADCFDCFCIHIGQGRYRRLLCNKHMEIETMKKLKEEAVIKKEVVVEEPGGLETLLGKVLLFHCGSYNYAGKLVGVNGNCLELAEAGVVFETGPYTGNCKKDFQPVKGGRVWLGLQFIEAYFEVGA